MRIEVRLRKSQKSKARVEKKKESFPTRSRTWNLLVPTGSGYVIVARRLDHWAMRNEA